MNTNERKINRDLVIGWSVIVVTLFVTYMIEVIKGERTLPYVIAFMIATGVPALICGLLYRKSPMNPKLRYYIVAGYFVMYIFVMCSGSTTLVFTYILPMLSLLILYHQPKLILNTGIVAMLINIVGIVIRICNHQITVSNSKDVEIQIALLILCFGGSYVSSRLYDEINEQNFHYMAQLDEKSKQLQRMTLQTIETIVNTIDAKDEYTKGHSRRVSEYAARIAAELQMSEQEINRIRYIALLHDIGKIGVPDAVLNKPGRLTNAEFDLMKKHTIIGGDILKDIGMLPDLDIGAKYHHERYDGNGYPSGLKGEEIPKIARIICLADAFDAMTSNRVYRAKLSKEAVLSELKNCRGSQFDPELTDVFLKYLDNAEEWVIEDRVEAEEDKSAETVVETKLIERLMHDQSLLVQSGAEVDSLTGVYNRTAGENRIVAAMEENNGCLILLNIDNMRQINRKDGYRQGDYYLKKVADMLKEVAVDSIVSRFGGDEFVCYVPNLTETSQIEERMDDFMKELYLCREKGELQEDFSVSAGITIYDRKGVELPQLLMEADKALYHVKQENKNGYYFYQQIAHLSDDVEKVDWNRVFATLQKHINSGQGTENPEKDLVRIYDVMHAATEEDSRDVRLIMFTAKLEDEKSMSIEERDDVMQMIEYAIANTLQEENVITKYSSVQRIIMLNGEQDEKIQEITQNILTNFYKMYDKKNVELYYDIAGMDSGTNPRIEER